MIDLAGRSICIVGINFEPETTGIGPYTTAMARTLAEANARVSVITGIPHYPQWFVADSSYRHGRQWRQTFGDIAVTRLRHHVPATPNLMGRARMEASFLAVALQAVRSDRSEAVIAVTPSLAGLAAGALGARGRRVGAVVQDLTGNAAGESGTTGGGFAGVLARSEYALLRRCDTVGIITPRFGDVLGANGIRPHRLMNVANFTHITPVDASMAEARARLGWDAEAFIVLHTGNMGRKQGLESVVAAARLAQLRQVPVHFVLVGDGNQRAELRAASVGAANIRFVDPLSATDYPFALAASDLLLLNERPGVLEMSLPSKLTSYSVANRPIVAAVEINGITHATLADGAYADFAEPGNPESLLAIVDGLRHNPARRDELAASAARLHLEKYSAEAAHNRYLTFASTVLNVDWT